MCDFASDNPPDLFNGIQVRGIGRKIYENNFIYNILINSVEILLNQPFGISMPWGVVHNHVIFDSIFQRIVRRKITDRGNDGFIGEPSGLVDPQFPGGRNDKAAVSDVFSSGSGFHFRTASNQSPNPRYQRGQRKMDLILKTRTASGFFAMSSVFLRFRAPRPDSRPKPGTFEDECDRSRVCGTGADTAVPPA